MKYNLNFYTSYHQFYICDKLISQNTSPNSFWTDDAFKERLAIAENGLGVSVGSEDVKVKIVFLDKPNNNINYDDYDHIVEGSLKINSGILQVQDCPFSNIELEIKIKPGNYKIRVYSSNLDTVTEDEGGNDFYKVEIWQDSIGERKVLKQYIHKIGNNTN